MGLEMERLIIASCLFFFSNCASSKLAEHTQPILASDDFVVVGPKAHGCAPFSTDVTWDLSGQMEVSQVLAALAPISCNRYIVPREVLRARVTLAASKEKMPAREMGERVTKELLAQGIALGSETAYLVEKASNAAIRCEELKCVVKRDTVKQILDDMGGASTAPRIIPHIEGGQPNGFSLYLIHPLSPLARLGLQDRDTIKLVNGMDVTTPEEGVEVYRKLRSIPPHITVEIVRDGHSMTLEYTIE